MNGDDIVQLLLMVAFGAMTIYFSIKAKQIEKENPLREDNNNK